MARYGQDFKNKALATLSPLESASLQQVAAEVSVSVSTLERWRSDALSQPRSGSKLWSAAARFDALLTTAAMDETAKSAWCRANGVLLHDLQLWRQTAAQSLADPRDQRASPSQTAQDQRRIKGLERELRRKEKALAETAALLVLSKKLETIFQKGREALFRTAKYRPAYPQSGLADLGDTRAWAMQFVHWYNLEHRHSGIRYVTPAQRHSGQDVQSLQYLHELYQRARQEQPARWARHTRNWDHIAVAKLNPEWDSEPVGATASVRIKRPDAHESGDNYLDTHRCGT